MWNEEAGYEAEREYFSRGDLVDTDDKIRAVELELTQAFEAAIAHKGEAA